MRSGAALVGKLELELLRGRVVCKLAVRSSVLRTMEGNLGTNAPSAGPVETARVRRTCKVCRAKHCSVCRSCLREQREACKWV